VFKDRVLVVDEEAANFEGDVGRVTLLDRLRDIVLVTSKCERFLAVRRMTIDSDCSAC
jgi:hypothetical protein